MLETYVDQCHNTSRSPRPEVTLCKVEKERENPDYKKSGRHMMTGTISYVQDFSQLKRGLTFGFLFRGTFRKLLRLKTCNLYCAS